MRGGSGNWAQAGALVCTNIRISRKNDGIRLNSVDPMRFAPVYQATGRGGQSPIDRPRRFPLGPIFFKDARSYRAESGFPAATTSVSQTGSERRINGAACIAGR